MGVLVADAVFKRERLVEALYYFCHGLLFLFQGWLGCLVFSRNVKGALSFLNFILGSLLGRHRSSDYRL